MATHLQAPFLFGRPWLSRKTMPQATGGVGLFPAPRFRRRAYPTPTKDLSCKGTCGLEEEQQEAGETGGLIFPELLVVVPCAE